MVPPEVGAGAVARACGASAAEARVALAVAGTPSRAVDYLRSPSRREVRRLVVQTLDSLARSDSWDVILAAKAIADAVRVPLEDVKNSQEAALKQTSDFLTPAALKQVGEANKRELTASERSGMMEALAAAESLLRDVLIRCEEALAPIVKEDGAAVVERLAAASDTASVLRALEATSAAADGLAHNVTAQLVLETLLLRTKDALECPPSYR